MSSVPHALPASTKYFPALTGIRAVAAFMVVLFHFNPLVYVNQQNIAVRWLNYFIQQLHVGVPIFFVLSGFLITYRYINTVELSERWIKQYLWNRFTRIYPMYFILTAITFLLLEYMPAGNAGAWQTTDFSWKDKAVTILLNITLLKAFFKTLLTSGIPTAWSLTVEESFYILAPLLLNRVRQNMIYIIIFPVVFLLAGTLLVFLASLSPYFLYGFMKSMNLMLRFTFFGRCVEFMCGMGLAVYIVRNQPILTNRLQFTIIGVAGVICCIVALAIIKSTHIPTTSWPTSEWSILVQNFVLPLFVALLFYGILTEKSSVANILKTNIFILLGKSSYVLYLLHIGPIDNFFAYAVSQSSIIRIAFYYAASIFIFKFIEEPILIKLRNQLNWNAITLMQLQDN
ncbi:acyltransferase [Hymenobacter sp. YC55]|uniref:acyltransferase family protein n=1 Tax=Hymenobacter sp. YC55 TaxID=3034019 RepID=UPI0023F7381B|nr:acyltransferase [Hymenobacter sp. YC55]MDF7811662.1 acyltransferase [Hymenobacter sp. YC55]